MSDQGSEASRFPTQSAFPGIATPDLPHTQGGEEEQGTPLKEEESEPWFLDPSHFQSVRSYCPIPFFPKLCQVLVFMRDETKKAFAMEEQATRPELREKVGVGRDGGREGGRERGNKERKQGWEEGKEEEGRGREGQEREGGSGGGRGVEGTGERRREGEEKRGREEAQFHCY